MLRDQSEIIEKQASKLMAEKQKCIEELNRRKQKLTDLNSQQIEQLVENQKKRAIKRTK